MSSPLLASIWQALGAATLHFLWQGALIGIVMAVVLDLIRTGSAATRHLACCIALFSSLTVFLGTFFFFFCASGPMVVIDEFFFTFSETLRGTSSVESVGVSSDWIQHQRVVDVLAWIWSLGVVVMTLRFGFHWNASQRLLIRQVSSPDENLQKMFDSLCQRYQVCSSVRLLLSSTAAVPMVIGWFRPVVLLPVFAMTALTPEQLRAVLTHELAHICRRDHLVNRLQCFVEILLFFHPVTWWLSRRIRIEREFCCDQSTLVSMADPVVLAEALFSLESKRIQFHNSILSSQGGSLMERISQILGIRQRATARLPLFGSLTSFLLVMVLVLGGFPAGLTAATALASFDGAVDPVVVTEISDDESDDDEALVARYRELEKRLKTAVEAGRMSAEDAEKKLIEA
ncbi:MAG: M56 family metallopeptidase, partial [Planctomycetota bacterium]